MRRLPRALLVVVVLAAALWPVAAAASVPFPASTGQADPYAYQNYLWAGGTGTGSSAIDCNAATTHAPSGFNCNDFIYSSKVDPTVEPGTGTPTSQELGGVIGPSVDKAWDVSTGRPDVHIAVLDSGIKWHSYDDMVQLRNKVALNWAELPPPEVAAGTSPCGAVTLPSRSVKLASPGFPACYDLNHDGVFNLADYAGDPRVNAPNHTWFCTGCGTGGKSLLTPEDLIQVFTCWDAASDPAGHALGTLVAAPGAPTSCSNGTQEIDNDGNGFPHDIAGWNFMEHTNDPYDEPAYSHGTGEAEDSSGEANINNGAGTCPSCMVLPLKVGNSFIADVNDFAQAVLYATDNQVNVVQEALGTLNNSSLNQAALDYAYAHGVTVISSAADEEASHHNQPASSENHVIVVNSTRLDDLHDQAGSMPAQFQGAGARHRQDVPEPQRMHQLRRPRRHDRAQHLLQLGGHRQVERHGGAHHRGGEEPRGHGCAEARGGTVCGLPRRRGDHAGRGQAGADPYRRRHRLRGRVAARPARRLRQPTTPARARL